PSRSLSRPTQVQDPAKNRSCSKANTRGDTYASRGSIRLWPNGRSDGSRSTGSKGGAGAPSLVGPPACCNQPTSTDSSVSINRRDTPDQSAADTLRPWLGSR